jgi:hypothetical protein
VQASVCPARATVFTMKTALSVSDAAAAVRATSTTALTLSAVLALTGSLHGQDSFGSDDPVGLTLGMARAGTTTLYQTQGGATYWDTDRPDRDAPYGVPYTQTVDVGRWLVAYSYDYTSEDGLRAGRTDLTSAQLFMPPSTYTSVPTSMTTQTHQLEALYGWDGDWTVFAQLPVHVKHMDNVTSTGQTFGTSSSGVGDVLLGGVRTLGEIDGEMVQVHIGLAIPTGSFDERDDDQNGMSQMLPYTMQLGTGTFGLYPGVTYKQQRETWSWGLQARGDTNIGKNSDDWGASNTLTLNGWMQRPLSERTSASVRLEGHSWGDYHGQSAELEARQDENPANNEKFQGGTRVDLLAGMNFDLGPGHERTQRIALEAGLPLDEWNDGPQLSVEWFVSLGWQMAF